jgi:sec-independent protein translocase protein TatC
MQKQTIIKTLIYEMYLRHLYVLNTFILTFIIAYEYSYELLYLLVKPLNVLIQQKQNTEVISFIFTDISESFKTHLSITIICSIFFTIIFYIYQIILFLIPALFQKDFKILNQWIKLILISFLLLIPSILNIILPQIWKFFLTFEHKNQYSIFSIVLQARIIDYISLSIQIITIFICIYIVFILINLNLYYYKTINITMLIKFRKYIYLAILTIAALISPPDILSQILFSIPIIFGYEITICCYIIYQKYNKQLWRRQDSNLR